MNLQKAMKIIEEYGDILVIKSDGRFATVAAPISMLPYPEDEIKTAIKTCLVVLTAQGKLNDKMKNHLEGGYVMLADFIGDGQAKIADDFEKWVRKGSEIRHGDIEDLRKHSSLCPEDFNRVPQIYENIHKESATLLEELRELRRQFQLE